MLLKAGLAKETEERQKSASVRRHLVLWLVNPIHQSSHLHIHCCSYKYSSPYTQQPSFPNTVLKWCPMYRLFTSSVTSGDILNWSLLLVAATGNQQMCLAFTKTECTFQMLVYFLHVLTQLYSTFFVGVPPDTFSLQLCTPRVVGTSFKFT